MRKFEYYTVRVSTEDESFLDCYETFNDLGADGWELVTGIRQ